jgi:serine/threonine protein kinase HipA of HipAB toxin-antitoxin module
LFDMRPAGYLGRAYAARHGGALGLPARLVDWSDSHALRALIANGEDVVGNVLLGETARDRFLAAPLPEPIAEAQKADRYAALAREAAGGNLPGSSAGGEQPKFIAYASTPDGPRHVLVKFSEPDAGPVGERWRDLLLAEHLALETLREGGIAAATTRLIDTADQRFLEVERFDRAGTLGRRAVFSLSALDAEFVGAAASGWPTIAQRLAAEKVILPQAAESAALLWAFGTLIGNTDMHGGNLSFLSEQGPPCDIAPAYDMSPMGFAPRSGGGLPESLADPTIDPGVANETWRRAEVLARAFLDRVVVNGNFSRRFEPCIGALERRLDTASTRIERLGP